MKGFFVGRYDIRFASGFWCLIVSEDSEKTFAEAADHIIYQANNYSEWLSAAGLQPLSAHLGDREQLRQSGLLKVVDPDTAISMMPRLTTRGGFAAAPSTSACSDEGRPGGMLPSALRIVIG